MTPQEKARQLYDRIEREVRDHTRGVSMKEFTRECCLVMIEEMLNSAGYIWGGQDSVTGLTARDRYRKYWEEVKQEIQHI